MLLGYARGKVGSLVFSRRKGEQITRPRNFHPANPRTNAQMTQRMKMYAPVKLYKQSMARFFKYAFKLKASETIFNAFMRENITIAPFVPRDFAAAGAPIPFPARMSSGSLASVNVPYYDDAGMLGPSRMALVKREDEYLLGMSCLSQNEVLSVGDFSSHFLTTHPDYQVGDQLTFVVIGTSALSEDEGEIEYDNSGGFVFNYAKVVLDPDSGARMEDLGFLTEVATGQIQNVGLQLAGFGADAMVAGCVIVTRINGSLVDASNSTLTLNTAAERCYNIMRSNTYREKAALTYRVEPDAYLNPATTD